MTDFDVAGVLGLAASFIVGVLVGLLFFGGLWLTVAGMSRARHPAIWIMASLLLRFFVVLAAFYLIVRFGGWPHLVAAALAFALMRFLVVRKVRPRPLTKESDA